MCEHRCFLFGQSRVIDLPIACFYDIDGIYHVTLHHAYHAIHYAHYVGIMQYIHITTNYTNPAIQL